MFFDSMYQLVDLWAGNLNVRFFAFLYTLFHNIAYWDESDNPEPMWKLRQLVDVGCIGEKFEEIKEEARQAKREEAEREAAAAAAAEQVRVNWDREKAIKLEQIKSVTAERQAQAAHRAVLGKLQMQALDLDQASADLRRRLESETLTDEEREDIVRQLASLERERIDVMHGLYDAKHAELLRRQKNSVLSGREKEAIRQQIAQVKQNKLELAGEALDADETEVGCFSVNNAPRDHRCMYCTHA